MGDLWMGLGKCEIGDASGTRAPLRPGLCTRALQAALDGKMKKMQAENSILHKTRRFLQQTIA